MAGKQYSLDSRMDLVQSLVNSSARSGDTMPTMRENSVEHDICDSFDTKNDSGKY